MHLAGGAKRKNERIPPPMRSITRVIFGIFSESEIYDISVAEIVNPSTDGSTYKNDGHLGDLRMGTSDRGERCLTCEMESCDGHFGHITFSEPMPNPRMLMQIKSVLKCVCIICGKFINTRSACKHLRDNVTMDVKRACVKIPKCEGIPKFLVNDEEMTMRDVNTLFLKVDAQEKERISKLEEKALTGECIDVRPLCGIIEPQNMIMKNMLVPPPCIRLSGSDSSNKHSRVSHLTQTLGQLIECNNELRRWLLSPPLVSNSEATKSARDRLWNHITMYVGTVKATHPSGQALESLASRIDGKKGRVRKDTFGKRVDFCGRSVIVPDPNLDPDELMIPYEMAKKLTVPINISNLNIRFFSTVFKKSEMMAGIHSITTKDGSKIIVKDSSIRNIGNMDLANIVSVECSLNFASTIKDIYVAFNRQPTLHKGSFMGFRLKIAPRWCKTNAFHVPPVIVTPFNADFDGDEMNVHVPQSEESSVEIKEILGISHNMRSESHCDTQIALLQDSLTMASISTSPDMIFWTREQAMMIIFRTGVSVRLPVPSIIRPVSLWTTHQILSVLIPSTFNYAWPTKQDIDTPAYVGPGSTSSLPSSGKTKKLVEIRTYRPCVMGGILLFGQLNKQDVGPGNRGMLDSLILHLGKDACSFMGHLQRMMLQVSDYIGFSIGLEAMWLHSYDIDDEIGEAIGWADADVYSVYMNRREFPPIAGMTYNQMLESRVISTLSKIRQNVEKIIHENISHTNPLEVMTVAGSKGNRINTAQMLGCLGQLHGSDGRSPYSRKLVGQMYNYEKLSSTNQRIPARHLYKRTLPHFNPGDWRPSAHRFVANSLITGLKPWEFWAHAQCGREGMIDTPLSTPVSGSMYRDMCKRLCDHTVTYTNAVVDVDRKVSQLSVNNGMGESSKLKHCTLKIPEWSDRGMLLDSTREILKVWSNDRTEETIATISRILQRVCSTHDSDRAPTSDQLCIHHSAIINGISMVISEATVSFVIGYDTESIRDDRVIEKISAVGMEASADIFVAWYTVTLSNEIRAKHACEDVNDWKSLLCENTMRTIQPIDVNVCAAWIKPVYNTSRHKTVLRIMELSAEIICDKNRCVSGVFRDHLCTAKCLSELSKSGAFIDTPAVMLRCILTIEFLSLEHPNNTSALCNNRVRDIPDDLIEYIQASVGLSEVSPKKAVGLCAAMSICEQSTQMTLNTFSVAGQQSVGLGGLPLLKELFNFGISKEPTMIVRMNPPMPPPEYLTTIEEKKSLKDVMDSLLEVRLKDLVVCSGIYYLPGAWSPVEPHEAESLEIAKSLHIGTEMVIKDDSDFDNLDFILSDWMARIELSEEKMTRHGISIESVRATIGYMFEAMHVISSEDEIGYHRPFIYIRSVRGIADGEDAFAEDDIEQSMDMSSVMIDHYRSIINKYLMDMCVGGVSGIKSVHISEKPVIGAKFDHRNETVLLLEGVSRDVFTAHPSIDFRRTFTTSINDMLDMFGIEAARRMFELECENVFSMSGTKSNPIHLSMVSDIFTQSGGYNCASISKIVSKDHVFHNMSFRQATRMAVKAAVFRSTDTMTSVASSTVAGTMPRIEAASADFFLDTSAIENSFEVPNPMGQHGNFFPDEEVQEEGVLNSPRAAAAAIYNTSSPAYGVSPENPLNGQHSTMSPMHSSPMATITRLSPQYHPTSPVYNPSDPSDYDRGRYGPSSPAAPYARLSPGYVSHYTEYSPTVPGFSGESVAQNTSYLRTTHSNYVYAYPTETGAGRFEGGGDVYSDEEGGDDSDPEEGDDGNTDRNREDDNVIFFS